MTKWKTMKNMKNCLIQTRFSGSRPGVRDITLEISNMFVLYSILSMPIKLSFKKK